MLVLKFVTWLMAAQIVVVAFEGSCVQHGGHCQRHSDCCDILYCKSQLVVDPDTEMVVANCSTNSCECPSTRTFYPWTGECGNRCKIQGEVCRRDWQCCGQMVCRRNHAVEIDATLKCHCNDMQLFWNATTNNCTKYEDLLNGEIIISKTKPNQANDSIDPLFNFTSYLIPFLILMILKNC